MPDEDTRWRADARWCTCRRLCLSLRHEHRRRWWMWKRLAIMLPTLKNVVVARHYAYMCSDPGQALIKEDIRNEGLDRVVVASCSPLMHESTFRKACAEAGLNPFLFQMTNIREHCSWVTDDPAAATEKAKALVAAAVQPGCLAGSTGDAPGCRSSSRRWWWAAGSPASRRPCAWRIRANMSTWWSANRPSAGTCPGSTKPSQRSTVRPEYSHPKWCPWDATPTSHC